MIFLARDGAFWLLLTVNVVARLENCRNSRMIRAYSWVNDVLMLMIGIWPLKSLMVAVEGFDSYPGGKEKKMGLVWVC